jgi:hypothetical protein
MIVREEPDSFMLVEQHEHDQISGEFAKRWREQPRPFEPTIYAIANHDLAWQEIDKAVRWNEATGKPYAFINYPIEPKLRAYSGGLDLLESRSPYAACLCSMHYVTIVQGSEGEEGHRFEASETARQQRLERDMSAEELDNLEHNLRLLKLCDGLSLFICLNEPGETAYPPPCPNGFELAGQRYEPVWEDRSTLRLDPNPFSEPFDLVVPYTLIEKSGRSAGSNHFELRVTC